MKVQLSINDELMKKVDEYADANYFTRSSLFTVAVTDYINSKMFLNAMQDFTVAVQQIAEKNEIDEDTKQELKKMEVLVEMLKKGVMR